MSVFNSHPPPQRIPSSPPQSISRSAQMSDKQNPNLLRRPPYDIIPRFVPNFPRTGQIIYNSKAFLICQSTPLSSRSPSLASWCSFDSYYGDGLVIEEIDSDLNDSSVEAIEGEYEDPPSDDENWDRWRYRQQQGYNKNVIISDVEELPASDFTPAIMSPQLLYTPTSPAPSTGFKRSFREAGLDGEETDWEDNQSPSGRRTRRRLTHKAPSPLSRLETAPVTRDYGSHISDEFEMEE